MSNPRKPISAGWFVMTVVASGAIQLTLDLSHTSAPVQVAARLVLLWLVFAAAMTGLSRDASLPQKLVLPLAFFVASALASGLYDAFRTPHVADSYASFMFVYGTGVLMIVYLFVPISVRLTRTGVVFASAAVLFGIAQVAAQDLMLPDAYRERFGVVFDQFVNGRIRALSFFASPPRFAELCAFVLCLLNVRVIAGKARPSLVVGIAYGLTLFALFSTYSRSGYILFIVTCIAQLVIYRRVVRERAGLAFALAFGTLLSLIGLVLGVNSAASSDAAIFDQTSLVARNTNWSSVFADLQGAGPLSVLFGQGKAARFSFLSSDYFVLDNLILALVVYGGLIAVFAFLILHASLISSGVSEIRSGTSSTLTAALTPFLVGLLFEGMFVDNHNTVFLVQFAALGALVATRRMAVEPAPAQALRPVPGRVIPEMNGVPL